MLDDISNLRENQLWSQEMSTLYMTPLGYTNRRPAGLPSIDRGALMRDAHQVAKRMRSHFNSYREALAYGLAAAWQQVKAARTMRSLALQVSRPAVPLS